VSTADRPVPGDESSGERGDDDLTPPPADPSASQILGEALGSAAKRAGIDPDSGATTGRMVWAAIGGVRGIAESVLPGLAFIIAFTTTQDLILSLVVSVGLAAVFTVLRLLQRSTPAAALGGLVAAAAAAVLALITGNAGDNFVPGLVTNAAYGLGMLISALVGWPLIGLVAGYLMGEPGVWRADRRKRRTFFWLTIAWAALFFLRLAVQLPLYIASLDPANTASAIAALGTLKLAMGLPLFAPMLAVTWLVVRALYPPAPKGVAADASDAT